MDVTIAFSNGVSVPTGVWTSLGTMFAPGVFVPIVSALLADTETLDLRIVASNLGAPSFLIDEPTITGGADITRAGWHGPPYPMPPSVGWELNVSVMNNNAAAVDVLLQVLQIS